MYSMKYFRESTRMQCKRKLDEESIRCHTLCYFWRPSTLFYVFTVKAKSRSILHARPITFRRIGFFKFLIDVRKSREIPERKLYSSNGIQSNTAEVSARRVDVLMVF